MTMDHLVATGGHTYRVSDPGNGEIDEIIDWLTQTHGQQVALIALSRQQVLTRLGRAALPADFPDPDLVIGDPNREAGHTRGWLEDTVIRWENTTPATLPLEDTTASTSADDAPQAADDSTTTAAGWEDWDSGRLWSGVPSAADDQIVIVTSRGVVTPSGKTLTRGPMRTGEDLGDFLVHRWRSAPKRRPQLWLTYEALEGVGFSIPDDEICQTSSSQSDQVAALFGCTISHALSGWFTCKFPDHDNRQAHLVLIPLLDTDPPEQRPGDMGIGGWAETVTELPDDEADLVSLLADRIGWLATLMPGTVPSQRWANVGAELLDAVRRRSPRSRKPLAGCPLPADVITEMGARLEPIVEPDWDNRDHKARAGRLDVEVDQRSAYLASAGLLDLGFGTPKELHTVDPAVFDERRPPFGLWHLTTPPAGELDGLTTKLPLPIANMNWTEEATFWVSTRGVQQLTAPVEHGGAGLSIAELQIDAAWVWPEQARLLRTWADALRAKIIEARDSERDDYESFIKAIYQAYLGRMASSKWQPAQHHHQQPAWYAAIRADTRWRAMRYARRLADTYGLYPGEARLDAWFYRVEPDQDLEIFNEDSTALGKYRLKNVSGDQPGVQGGAQ